MSTKILKICFEDSQVGLRRRQLLTLSLGHLFARKSSAHALRNFMALFATSGAALLPTRVAAEPVTIALAVASTVAGLIAANNRSDGGMGAILKTTLEYQRVMSQQLLSLQQGMGELLVKVNALPGEIQRQLHQERLNALHAKLGGLVVRYHQEASVRASRFNSYQEWTEDNNTKVVLNDILIQLDQVAGEVVRGRWIDALTALYLPSAVYTSLAVRGALGERPEQLKAEAQRYLDLFQLVESDDEFGSAASDLVIRSSNVEQATKELAAQRLVVPNTDVSSATELRMGRVAVQDYTPRTLISATKFCVPPSPDNNNNSLRCRDTSTYANERIGERETFGFFVKITPFFVQSTAVKGAPSIAIRQLTVDSTLRTDIINFALEPDDLLRVSTMLAKLGKVASSTSLIPPTIITSDARTSEARKAVALRSPEYQKGELARVLLSDTVARFNEETARVALCLGALTAASLTRQGLFKFFGREA
jgi:hypothetical protein